MEESTLLILPLFLGYLMDLVFGDPEKIPHPVRVYGNAISTGERLLNRNRYKLLKGIFLAIFLCFFVYSIFSLADKIFLSIHPSIYLMYSSIFVFFGLANRGLIDEGRKVFYQLEKQGIQAGRKQLSRIVGRDTSNLNHQQIRIAVLETMSENLSDGVIAPLFYYALAGVPGLMTYKMINTMDSMIGYRNARYEYFGKFAARLDDVANFVPARITALLMVIVSLSWRGFVFVIKYGHKHKSPNAGYPEAALAGILNCRFGGPNYYHGTLVEKPYIGEKEKVIGHETIHKTIFINHATCLLMVICIIAGVIIFT